MLDEAPNHPLNLVGITVFEAIFNDIRAKLLLTLLDQVLTQVIQHSLCDLVVLHLEYVLHHVVCERILHESQGVVGYSLNKGSSLVRRARVNALLHDAAAMLMAGDGNALGYHLVVDELALLRSPGLQDLEEHMVSIHIETEPHELWLEVARDQLDVLLPFDDLYHLLDGPCPVLIMT